MNVKKATGIYLLIYAVINAITWPLLILTDQVPDLHKNLLKFIFHGTSEYMMDFFAILAGYLLLKKTKSAQKVLYSAFGMALTALTGMLAFYSLQEFNHVFVIMATLFILAFLGLTIKNYESISDYCYLTLGGVLYAQINVLGEALMLNNLSGLASTSLAMVLTIGMIILSFNLSSAVHKRTDRISG
ncbi:MAG: hypothetical protein ACFFD4_06165 [Candidatus Odinarchaeota archaeon]